MDKLDTILGIEQRQLSFEDLMMEIDVEEENVLVPGMSVGHMDFANFRAIYIGSGRRPGQALVRVVAGWTREPPALPVSIPYSKLVEV